MNEENSKMQFYRTFKKMDVFHYQCSVNSTSNEIKTVFENVIERQRSHDRSNLNRKCVVFLDEGSSLKFQ